MAFELFSMWGGYTGSRSGIGDRWDSEATFDGKFWYSGVCVSLEEADRRFYRAARQAFVRRLLRKVNLRQYFCTFFAC